MTFLSTLCKLAISSVSTSKTRSENYSVSSIAFNLFLLVMITTSKISGYVFSSEKTNTHLPEYTGKGRHIAPIICQEKYF